MKGGLDMGENIRSRELDLALFHLNTAIHEKLGDDYVNLSYTFDRMDTIEVIETMLKSVKRAYRGYVMGQLAEENENLDRRLNNAKREMNRLEREMETYNDAIWTLSLFIQKARKCNFSNICLFKGGSAIRKESTF